MYATLSLLAAVTTMLQGSPARAPVRASRAAHAAPAAADLAFATLLGDSAQTDPGDSLYRVGRQLLNRGRYPEAARAFNDLIKRYPRSSYTPDAHYWAAFALYRTGDHSNLLAAAALLETQASHYPRAATRGDGDALLSRVEGEMARRGDSDAAQWVQAHAAGAPGADSAHVSVAACPN